MDDFLIFVERIGERIRELRKARGLSQEELAGRANMHPTYIGQFERNERKNPSLKTIFQIASGLDIELDELLSQEENTPKEQVRVSERARFFEDLSDDDIKLLEGLVRRIKNLR